MSRRKTRVNGSLRPLNLHYCRKNQVVGQKPQMITTDLFFADGFKLPPQNAIALTGSAEIGKFLGCAPNMHD